MVESTYVPFSRAEAVSLWSWMVAGWANSLDSSGARTLIEGVPNYADAGGSFEGVTRMLWGLGSWLAYPERGAHGEWRGEVYDLEALTYRALVNGCDPNSSGYWGNGRYRTDWDQRTVETAQVTFALWQTRERIWTRMSEDERANVIAFLDRFGQRPSRWMSNWSLFWAVNHSGRKALGADYDQTIINEVMNGYLDGVYCGDGWYDDVEKSGENHFDDYITWVFAMHVMAWAQMDGETVPERRDELLERVRAWMQHYPYFFAADGAYCEFGRSAAYKFCRLGAPIWAYKLGIWPHSPGMLKRLVSKHMRWYVDRGAVRTDGTLRQTLTATGSPEIIERYISTGAPYWAMQAFSGLWALLDDDPFWQVEEELLPSEQGDYTKVFPQPGWVVTATDGHVQRFNAGSVKRGYGGKYAKFVYSTRNPFNAGLDAGQIGVDSNLCLSENGVRGQRESVLACAVGESGWLRMRYPIQLNDHQHMIETILIPFGDVHLRAHQITFDPAAKQVTLEEGSAPLGYDAGAVPVTRTEAGWLFIEFADNAVGISPLQGYSSAAKVVSGSPNSVYGYNLLALLEITPLSREHELICAVYAGAVPETAHLPKLEHASWESDGRFIAHVTGNIISVPPLPATVER